MSEDLGVAVSRWRPSALFGLLVLVAIGALALIPWDVAAWLNLWRIVVLLVLLCAWFAAKAVEAWQDARRLFPPVAVPGSCAARNLRPAW